MGPRHPAFPETDCGRCVEVMRDLAIQWRRTETRDRNSLFTVMEEVCEDIELRHAPQVRDDIREHCEEVSTPEYMREKGVTAAVLAAEDLPMVSESPYITAGFLATRVCSEKAQACSLKELDTLGRSMTEIPGRMFREGVKATTEEGRLSIQKARTEHEAKLDGIRNKAEAEAAAAAAADADKKDGPAHSEL